MAKQEEKIQEEIRKRVIQEQERHEQRKTEDANREALAEITSVSREDVDRIARTVRGEIEKKQSFFKSLMIYAIAGIVVIAVLSLIMTVFQYNKMVSLDEKVKKNWGQVENVYQRRLDLIPNLVETVKGYARHERDTFEKVTQARAKAGGMLNISEKILNDPEAFKNFQQAQNEISGALQKILLVVEKYPDLKANQNFLALQAQLEGTENRIAVERKRFNDSAQDYNSYIKRFPQIITAGIFNFKEREYFRAEQGAEKAPKVSFE